MSTLLQPLASAPPRDASAAPDRPLRDPASVRVLSPGAPVSLGEELRELWARRDLLVQLAARDVRIRYKQAVMGFAWAVLTPLLIVGAGALVRVAVVAMSGARLERAEIGSVIIKAFPWAFFSGAIGFGVNSIAGSMGLVTKIYFPRAVLPIAAVAANLFDLAVGAGILAVALPFFGAQLTGALLWVPALVLLLVMITAGLAMVLACANVFFRDIKYITQIALTFGIFFTPILFDAATFGPAGSRLLMLNPLAPVFEGLQLAVIRGHNLLEPLAHTTKAGVTFTAWEPWYLLYSLAWGAALTVGGVHLFRRTQDLFAEFA